MNIIEKIIANHSDQNVVKPGDIVDVFIDSRVARDFGGANVVKNLMENGLKVHDPSRTLFTFDCNPTGSDQKYAENQHYCRLFARDNNIKVYDIDAGIGTHIAIETGLVYPGSTFVSTDSHANIMGAVGAFGQGMGDQDIAAAWAKGSVWFKVPDSVKIHFTGKRPANVTAKDFMLNLLGIFGANTLLGYSVELYGECIDEMTLDERITIASMGTEMGVITILFPPSHSLLDELRKLTGNSYEPVLADADAQYLENHTIDVSAFIPRVSNPGHPHDTRDIKEFKGRKIDSAFIGSCTNGRIEDLRTAADILRNRKVAPGVVLKIVPATDDIWTQAMDEGMIQIFKDAGVLVSNAGCAGCAAGQVGQNGPNEVTISTGNRNFAGKQGKGEVFLASPAIVAASAVAGYITTPDEIPDHPAEFTAPGKFSSAQLKQKERSQKPTVVQGRVWLIPVDNIDTDMIFHNRYLTITNIAEMGQYAFDNLKGWEDFAKKAKAGDIIITGKNFGAGSSRQQAVDCFSALGISCILAESYGAIYERNAINAAMPILTYKHELLAEIQLEDGDEIKVDFLSGEMQNISKNKSGKIIPFYSVQNEIYQNGGLL
jgi:3-isopropylmalate/(R)-2-methylmalate dehydratase large subunit